MLKLIGYRKVGGLHHFRIGRFGGSVYVARKPVRQMSEWQIALHADRWLVRGTVAIVTYAISTTLI